MLLNLVGASIGRSAIAPSQLAGANISRAIALIPVYSGLSEWVCLNLRGPTGQRLIQSKVGGSAQPVLNLKEVRNIIITFPPLPEQQEIVRRVDALFALADTIEAKVAIAKDRTVKLRQSILAQAFSGQLVPTEAELARREGREYESAEMLLERIQDSPKKGRNPK